MRIIWLLICSVITAVGLASCSTDNPSQEEQEKINHAPIANFSYQLNDDIITLTNLSSGEDSDNFTYQWQLGADDSSSEF